MNRSHRILLSLIALFLATTAGLSALAGGDLILDALLQRPRGEVGTRVVPDRFLRRWDPITVFFRSPRDGSGPELHPERFVELSPDQPGAWTWLDASTLQFRPAEPWTPMSAVSVTVEKRTTEVFTLAAPPVRSTPSSGQRDLEPVGSIELSFSDPLPAATLARLTRIELRPLPGLSDDGLVILDADDFEVKALQRASEHAPAAYALVLAEPIPRGLQARVKIGLSLDTDAREAVHELVFSTSEPFRPVQMGCSSSMVPVAPSGSRYAADQPLRCRGDRELSVRFNAQLGELGPIEGRNLVRFEPAVEGLSFERRGRGLAIRGAFADDVLYKVRLEPSSLTDVAGRPLEMGGPSEVHLRFEAQAPYFRWGAGQGIVERHGPKRVPIEGRGVGQVDLRVYEVDPLNRELWPWPSSPIAVDERSRPPSPGEEPRPLESTEIVTVPGLRARLRALGSPSISTLVDVGLEGAAAHSGLELSDIEGPGHYLVGVRRVDGEPSRQWMRVQVTDLALTTLETGSEVRFFVTSLSTGRPISGARIAVEGIVSPPRRDARWETLIRGTTDSSGGFSWTAAGSPYTRVHRITVTKGPDVLVLDPNRAPDRFENGRWDSGGGAWLQWAFQNLTSRVESPQLLGHLFPERPVYRPEEDVHLKGYLRERFQGELSAASGTGRLVVRAPGGANWRLPVTVGKTGSFYARWSESDIPSGTYSAVYEHSDGRVLARTDFRVESYRLPTFEVDLSTPDNRLVVPNDQPFEVAATASYYAGGKVAMQPVSWRISQFPYTWSPEGLEGFRYSSDGRYARSGRFDSTPALQRRGRTDGSGSAKLMLDPGIEPTSQPRTYVIEAEVTGADQQTVTATARIHALPAFVLGLKVPRHLDRAEEIPIEAVAVGPDGKPISGTDITVRLIERQWHSVLQASDFSDGIARYVTDTVDMPLLERKLVSTEAPTALDLPIDEPGVYIVELEARDALGRVQVVSVDLYVGGEGKLSWNKAEAGVFDVSTDRDSYRPGQTAKLLIRSPFQTGSALVVVEGPKQNQYRSVPIVGGKATVPVKIREGWVPKLPIHVLLRRGRDGAAGVVAGMDLGKPETLGNTRWLTIEPVENTVEVALSHPERAMPGESIEVEVRLQDPNGKPLSGEVTLWLVDQAVLSLGTEKRLDPLPDFIPTRRSRFSAHDTRNLAFGRLPFSEMPGGDGGAESDDDAEDVLDKTAVRKDFRSVPYYEPAISVGPTGRTTVEVQLPDNLTVFKLRAKAASGPERFGYAKSSIRVRLPVLVQPDLPRFVRPGDSLEVAALGRVIEGDGGPGTAQIRVEGLRLEGSDKVNMSWDREGVARLAWPVTVPTLDQDTVKITIGAQRSSDGAGDAVEIRLPLLDDRRPRTDRQIIEVAVGAKGQLEALEQAPRPGSLSRTAVVSDHPGIVKMAAAMDIFVARPARSTGQQLDRARAWLGLGEIRGALGLEGAEIVDTAVLEAMAWLPSVLDEHGLIAPWPGGHGQVALTADALRFLEDARAHQHPIDSELRAKLIRSLKSALRSDYRYFLDGSSWYERTVALEALTYAGEGNEAYLAELADNVRSLGPDGTSSILLAAAGSRGVDSNFTRSLSGELESQVTIALFEGEERYRGLTSRGSPLSPLIRTNEAFTVANISRSLLAAEPDADKLPYLIDALVRLGGEDGWGERTDAVALLTLAQSLQGRSAEQLKLRIGDEQVATTDGLSRVVLGEAGAVPYRHESGPEGLIYVSTRYIPAQPGALADSRNRGFVLSRDQAVYREGSTTPDRFPIAEGGGVLRLELGQVVEEHIQLINPEDRSYVAIEVPLAAGVELLDKATPSKPDTRAATWVQRGDASLTYYFEQLPKGSYDFYFRTRATIAGRFVQPPAVSETLFDRSIVGSSPGEWVEVQ